MRQDGEKFCLGSDPYDIGKYKGIFFNGKTDPTYQDPLTGAHFNYTDLCRRLVALSRRTLVGRVPEFGPDDFAEMEEGDVAEEKAGPDPMLPYKNTNKKIRLISDLLASPPQRIAYTEARETPQKKFDSSARSAHPVDLRRAVMQKMVKGQSEFKNLDFKPSGSKGSVRTQSSDKQGSTPVSLVKCAELAAAGFNSAVEEDKKPTEAESGNFECSRKSNNSGTIHESPLRVLKTMGTLPLKRSLMGPKDAGYLLITPTAYTKPMTLSKIRQVELIELEDSPHQTRNVETMMCFPVRVDTQPAYPAHEPRRIMKSMVGQVS